MNLLEQLLNDALSGDPKRIAKRHERLEPKPIDPYIEALKDIDRCVKYLRLENGKIPKWRYEENLSVLKEAFDTVLRNRWYKD